MPLTTYVAGDVLTAASLNDNFSFAAASGGLVQLVSTTKTDTFSASVASGSNTAITGLSVSITPTSASNKILVFCNTNGSLSVDAGVMITLFRGATAIGVGASPGSRQAITSSLGSPATTNLIVSTTAVFLDSPATTSATTYSVNISHSSGITRTVFVNRSLDDANTSDTSRGISTITVMEVTP